MGKKDIESRTLTVATYTILFTFVGSTIASWVKPDYKLPDGITWLLAMSIGLVRGLKVLRGAGFNAEFENDEKPPNRTNRGGGTDEPKQ